MPPSSLASLQKAISGLENPNMWYSIAVHNWPLASINSGGLL